MKLRDLLQIGVFLLGLGHLPDALLAIYQLAEFNRSFASDSDLFGDVRDFAYRFRMAFLLIDLVFSLSLILGSGWWARLAVVEDRDLTIMEDGETLKAGLFALVGAWLAATSVSDLVSYFVSWQQSQDLGTTYLERPQVFGSAVSLGIGFWLLLFNADLVASLKAMRSPGPPDA